MPSPGHNDDSIARLRVPPHSLEAEQSVLGGLLLDNTGWDRAGGLLAEGDFYSRQHRLIYGAIGRLINANKPADIITVGDKLGDDLAGAGGLSYLNAMAASVPSAANIRRYAEIVREKAVRRKMISLTDEAATAAFGEEDIALTMDKLQTAIGLVERGADHKAPRPLEQILTRRLDRLNDIHTGEDDSAGGHATIFPRLNDLLNGGLRGGKVYVIAARPSVGKSALAQAIGLHAARVHGDPTLFLSQEMPEDELGDRALSNLGAIDFGRLQSGRLQDIDWGRLSEAVETGASIPFYVDDEGGLNIAAIRRKARAIRGLKVLILDYLQLSEAMGDHSNRNGAIEEISRGLKKLAKDLDCSVIVLSQLNRKVEERTHKRPIMSDLRDSGAIEQDADVIVFLFPLKTRENGECQEVGVSVDKNRQGKKGEFAVNFWGAHMAWGESTYLLRNLLDSKRGAASDGGFD